VRGVYCDGSSVRLRRDLPTPEPKPDEVRLRVSMAGICDTDLQLARGYMGFQGVLGHEFVGLTESGKRVTAEINNACGTCATCVAGRAGHCPHRTVLGILNHDGAMAEHVCVPRRNLHAIPSALDDREAVFIEPLAAAFRVTEQVELGSGTRVAVVGDGKLGLLCAQVARMIGAHATLVGKHPEKLALAGNGVAICTLDDVARLARSFDVVVDCTGSPTGLPTALGLVGPCGTVVLKTTIAAPHAVKLAPIVIDEVRVIGSRCGPFPKAIAALRDKQIDVRRLISGEYALDDADAAFQAASTPGARKILLHI
jgi:threonine dehydrogenase-like Zn-dependent dehydrogenase